MRSASLSGARLTLLAGATVIAFFSGGCHAQAAHGRAARRQRAQLGVLREIAREDHTVDVGAGHYEGLLSRERLRLVAESMPSADSILRSPRKMDGNVAGRCLTRGRASRSRGKVGAWIAGARRLRPTRWPRSARRGRARRRAEPSRVREACRGPP